MSKKCASKDYRVEKLHEWCQESELGFISTLGMHSIVRPTGPRLAGKTPSSLEEVPVWKRRHLLVGYLFALNHHRRRWFQGVDIPALREHAKHCLAELPT